MGTLRIAEDHEAKRIRILDNHGIIHWYDQDGALMVLDVATYNGELIETPINCPADIPTLYRWLGY